MLPLYIAIFTRCAFRLVSGEGGREDLSRSYVSRGDVRGDALPFRPFSSEEGLAIHFATSFVSYVPWGIRPRLRRCATYAACPCCDFISRMCARVSSPLLSAPLSRATGSTSRRSLANTFRRVSQAVLATCCCHSLVHKHLFLIKFR